MISAVDVMALAALPQPILPDLHQVHIGSGQFVATDAVCLPGINRGDSFTAKDIHRLRDGPEMGLVDAMADSTLMIELQALRDGTMSLNVGKAVSFDRLPSGIELSIPVLVQPSRPEDAAVLPWDRLAFEPLGSGAEGVLVAGP
jgi:hypothetical protein